ncbi:MAG: hemerythrin domain-containing protein [Georgfuchsia sp.]
MTDSLLPSAPSLDEPLEILEACHGRIEQQLQTLARLLDHLPQHGADAQAQQAATAVLRYFNTAGNNHHADEEENLFPLLRLRAGNEPRTEVLIAELLHDHEQMTAARTIVLAQLEGVASGDAKALLSADVEAMSAVYRTHIAHENTELLPLAARVLTPNDVRQLSRAMTARRQ